VLPSDDSACIRHRVTCIHSRNGNSFPSVILTFELDLDSVQENQHAKYLGQVLGHLVLQLFSGQTRRAVEIFILYGPSLSENPFMVASCRLSVCLSVCLKTKYNAVQN